MGWIIAAAVIVGVLLLYFLVGEIVFVKFFKRSFKPYKFKNDLSSKYDFSPDLEWLKRTHEELKIPDGHKNLGAWLIPYEGSHRYLVCLHGFKGSFASHSGMNHRLADALKANAVLTIIRGDRESSYAYTSVGVRESEDLLTLLAFLKKRDPSATFYILGVSMGAATCIFASDHYDPSVKAVVADSGFSSLKGELQEVFHKKLGFLTSFFLFPVTVIYHCHFHRGVNRYTDASLRKTSTPFFFIHGADDDFVPLANLDHHLKQMPTGVSVQNWTIPDCPHAIGDFAVPDEYFSKVSAFYESVTKEE